MKLTEGDKFKYSLDLSYMEIEFDAPHLLHYKEGDFLSVRVGNRLLFAGIVEVASARRLRLVNPLKCFFEEKLEKGNDKKS